MKLRETFFVSSGVCLLLVLAFFQYQTLVRLDQLSEDNIKIQTTLYSQNHGSDGASVLFEPVFNNLRNDVINQITTLHEKMTDLESRYGEFKEDVQLQLVKVSEDQSVGDENLRKKILEIEHELFYLAESLRFYFPQHRLKSAAQALLSTSIDSTFPKTEVLRLKEKQLKELSSDSSRLKRYPVLNFIKEKGYRLFDDGDEVLILKDKGVQEHLAYQLSGLFLPHQNPVPTRYIHDFKYDNEILHGTLQKFLKNLKSIESEHVHSLNLSQIQQIYRYWLIDYMIGNQERDYLYDAKTDRIVGVDVDESFDYSFDDWFNKDGFYHQLLVATAQDPIVLRWLIQEQYRLQSISDEVIELYFSKMPKGVRWDPKLSANEALEELLRRKSKLGDFIKRILLAMRF